MVHSMIDLWNAGGKALAILIAIISFTILLAIIFLFVLSAWPYMNLLISLFAWFAPPHWMSFKRRGSLFWWLDILGKWSIIKVFVLLMTLVPLRLSIESPDYHSFLPSGLYSINMLFVPLWGLYANMLAQIVSQISSHVMIHYHRKCLMAAIEAHEIDAPPSTNNHPRNLQTHEFTLSSGKRAIVKRSVHWILSAIFFIFVVLVICGCVLPSFGIETFGVVGLASKSRIKFEPAKDFYSVFGLAHTIMEQAHFLNTTKDLVGLGMFASMLVITIFLVPLAQAATLFVEWFLPMTTKQRLWNMALNEILSAWQYMEVYALSIIISSFLEQIINAQCGKLDGIFASLLSYEILSENDAQCFRIETTVEEAYWMLVAACFTLGMLNHFVSGASTQKTRNNGFHPERRLNTDRWIWRKDEDEERNSGWMDRKEPCNLPVKPQFTDYYFFATKQIIDQKKGADLPIANG
ncbi:hypothetical protein ACHAW5_010455 [Stephanodiscus triporus]|uniref:Uncharacterized protein n=1 Tax=Stephanodiscus triporus TaxID=2934178 RepID=A0ABD3PXF1_9STRA